MELDYEQDMTIDHEALDVEWVRQPELMGRYAAHAAGTKKASDEAKERLDVTAAGLDRNIRANPPKYGLDKITESAIQSTILLQEEHRKAVREFTEARYENDMAVAAVRAIDQRKTALENLVKLLIASYFAGPQASRDLSREWLEDRKRREANARVRINRRGEEEL